MNERRRLRVGQSITPEEFDELSDEQLARLVPKAYRDDFPGKDACADGFFYLHDGTAWSFYKGASSMNDALVRPRRPRPAIGLVPVPLPVSLLARVVPMPAWVPAWMSVVVLAITGAVAQAQPAPKPAPKPSAPLTIKQEVRACLDERETLRRERLALSQGFDRHEAAFRRAQDDLQAQTALKATLDLTQSAAVEAYNARVGEINGRIVALNAQAAELAESQRTLNTRVDDLNRRCAGVVISWRDHEAVLRERKASAP